MSLYRTFFRNKRRL